MFKEIVTPFCFLVTTELPHILKHKYSDPDNFEKIEKRVSEFTGVRAYGNIVIPHKLTETFSTFATAIDENDFCTFRAI